MSSVIKVENLSKQYRLGDVGTGTLRDDLKRWRYRLMGKEDPFLKIGEENDRNKKAESDYVWALKDINFEVEQGDVVGIIGRNGAGKSTLLKILSRTTAPTTGSVKVKGRIASLLEVGTGFHGELSGRENIYLNGAIMGLRKWEIDKKLDEIIDFAGVEKYLDTPVKRYSSGMYVRLAFAVAAHLEPDILIVDEVLAVGDAEFQKKCLGKMKDVSQGQGRTVLIVSHHLNIIQKICKNAILLNNSILLNYSTPDIIINEYLNLKAKRSFFYKSQNNFQIQNTSASIDSVHIEKFSGEKKSQYVVGEPWVLKVRFRINYYLEHFIVAVGITNIQEVRVNTTWSEPQKLEIGFYEAIFYQKDIILETNTYNINVGISNMEKTIEYLENVISFDVEELPNVKLDNTVIRLGGVGVILNPMRVEISSIS